MTEDDKKRIEEEQGRLSEKADDIARQRGRSARGVYSGMCGFEIERLRKQKGSA